MKEHTYKPGRRYVRKSVSGILVEVLEMVLTDRHTDSTHLSSVGGNTCVSRPASPAGVLNTEYLSMPVLIEKVPLLV